MEACLFCKIASGEVGAEVVYRDDHATAFLDIHPLAPGHVVVVPKVHAATLFDLPESEVGPVFVVVTRVAERIARSLSPDGFTYGINQGRASGQHVEHLHIHVVPRWEGDGGGSLHSIVRNPPKEGRKSIADRIRNVKI